jgi:hypothetical protein
MTTPNVYLSVILVMALIIIGFCTWRTTRCPRTSRIRSAVGNLFASIEHMVKLGRSFDEQARALEGTPFAQTDARRSVQYLTAVLDRAENSLQGANASYCNYIAVHRGLASSDQTLLAAADAYIAAGADVAQMARGEPRAQSLSNTLVSMGRQLRQITRAIRHLGAALEVE